MSVRSKYSYFDKTSLTGVSTTMASNGTEGKVLEDPEDEADAQSGPGERGAAAEEEEEEFDFVERPSEDFFCPVTFELLLDPHQTTCCGNHLSLNAVTRLQQDGKPCPMCKKPELGTVHDKFYGRKVSEVKVHCPNKSGGCDWKGEVSGLKQHIESCLKRQWTCQYCGLSSTYDTEMDHVMSCARYPTVCPNQCDAGTLPRCKVEEHIRVCPLEVVACGFAEIGCKVKTTRQDLERHMEESQQEHTLSATILNLRLTKETIAEKDRLLAEKDKLFADQVSKQERQLTEKDQLFAEKDRQLAEKDRQLAEKDKLLVDQLAKEDRRLIEKDQLFAEKDRQLTEKDRQLAKIAEKDRQLAEKDKLLAEKDQQLVEQLAEKDHQLAEKNVQLAEQLAQKDKQLLEKDKTIAMKDSQMLETLVQLQQGVLEFTGSMFGFTCQRFTLEKFSECQKEGEHGDWFSELFDVDGKGYQLKLNVETKEHGDHMKVRLYSKSANSRGIVFVLALQMLNQQSNYNHVFLRMIGRTYSASYPYIQFKDLYKKGANIQYLKDDCLKFVLWIKEKK